MRGLILYLVRGRLAMPMELIGLSERAFYIPI